METFGGGLFRNCPNLKSITYRGTTEEWKAINKGTWSSSASVKKIVCTDGVIEL